MPEKAWRLRELLLLYEDGRLLAHAALDGIKFSDVEILGSMITAVCDFVSDILEVTGKDRLLELQYGDMRLFMRPSSPMMLAGLVSGKPPANVGERLQLFADQTKDKYSFIVDDEWDGSVDMLGSLRGELNGYLLRASWNPEMEGITMSDTDDKVLV